MRNSPALPISALVTAAALSAVLGAWRLARADPAAPLSELEIGLVAWSFVLGLFGAQGLITIGLEGAELRPGFRAPRLTRLLTWAIVMLAVVLLALAFELGEAILTGQSAVVVGLTAGAGSVVLALLLVAYKEAFVGDEARFDARKDGIPW